MKSEVISLRLPENHPLLKENKKNRKHIILKALEMYYSQSNDGIQNSTKNDIANIKKEITEIKKLLESGQIMLANETNENRLKLEDRQEVDPRLAQAMDSLLNF